MKSIVAFILLALGALPILAADEAAYRCECCGAYFGKNPDAPTYWGKGLGYAWLMKKRYYEEAVSRFDDAYRKNDYTLEDVGWVGEALFALAAIKSGLQNPHDRFMFFQDGKPKDPIVHDVWWMHEKYKRKIWDKAAIERYGDPALCTITEVRKSAPQFPRFFTRYVTILIATGRFDKVIAEVRALRPDSLSVSGPLGEYLAPIMEQYIGSSLYEEGAAYLATVKKSHGLRKETQEHWTARLLRGVDEEPLSPARKKSIQAKIRAIK
jgi:hypothetical protein